MINQLREDIKVSTRVQLLGVAVFIAVVAMGPASASAGLVDDLLGGVNSTIDKTVHQVNGVLAGGGASPAPTPAPLADGATDEPPLDGTGPHAQGEVLDLELDTGLIEPVVAVVGQSRGEQDAGGNYHGKITLLSVLGLDVAQVETDEDNPTATGPLGSINDILDDLCTPTSICLGVLEFSSTTTGNGTSNNFSTLNANVGNGLVSTGVVESEGNMGETNRCQRADSSASVANLGALGLVNLGAMNSSSESVACRGEEGSTDARSEVLNLNGTGILGLLGDCPASGDGNEDSAFGLPLLIAGFCHADDTNGTQTEAPYNIRRGVGFELLDGVLELVGMSLALDGVTSETVAVAPEADEPVCPDPDNPDCPVDPECPDASNPDCPPDDECPDAENPDCPQDDVCPDADNPDCPNGPGGPSADGPGNLPFTGADLATLALIGFGVMGGGLGMMAMSDRRRRPAVE